MTLPSTISRRRMAGITLIELMVVIVVTSILVSMAYAGYSTSIRKSRRTEAKTALLDLAGREERFFSTTQTYSQTPTDLGYNFGTATFAVASGYYNVTLGG